jgi:hypothetical protein
MDLARSAFLETPVEYQNWKNAIAMTESANFPDVGRASVMSLMQTSIHSVNVEHLKRCRKPASAEALNPRWPLPGFLTLEVLMVRNQIEDQIYQF